MIEVLTGLALVQKRPGLYNDTSRPNHLTQGVVDNSVDEAIGRYWCTWESGDRAERHLFNSYHRAIDLATGVISSGKRREYVPVGSTAPSLPPTFPPGTTRIG